MQTNYKYWQTRLHSSFWKTLAFPSLKRYSKLCFEGGQISEEGAKFPRKCAPPPRKCGPGEPNLGGGGQISWDTGLTDLHNAYINTNKL